MIISQIQDLNDFDKIFEKYKYHGKNISFFQMIFFIEACKNNLNQSYSIFLVSDEKNFIILPLCKFKYNGLTFFGFLGSPDICEENDVIHNFRSFDKFSNLLDNFFKLKKKRYFFCNLKSGFFSNYLYKNKKFYELNSMSSNIVNLKENYYVNENKIRKSIDYDLRKFSKDTGIKQKIVNKDINYEEFLNLNILEFIRHNKAISNKKFSKILEFLIDLFKKKIVKINILKINNIILSSIIYTIHEKKLYYIIPVYNKKFKKFSFGKIHLDKLIKNNLDIDYLFLGPGEENYKKKFNLTNNRIFFYSNSLFLKYYYQIKSVFHGKNF